jgi:hypothetical protein
MTHRSAVFALALALCGAGAAHAAVRPQTTPLAEAALFISPCGEPFRSKPGEPYPVVVWFARTDVNKDGKIDRKEFEDDAAQFFHKLDVNKDGIVGDYVINFYEKRLVPEILAGLQGTAFRSRADAPRLIKVQMAGSIPGSQNNSQIDPGAAPDLPPPHPHEDDGPPKGAAAFGLLNDPEPIRTADRSFASRIRLQDFIAQADRNFDALDYKGRGYLTLETLPRTPAQEVAAPVRKK